MVRWDFTKKIAKRILTFFWRLSHLRIFFVIFLDQSEITKKIVTKNIASEKNGGDRRAPICPCFTFVCSDRQHEIDWNLRAEGHDGGRGEVCNSSFCLLKPSCRQVLQTSSFTNQIEYLKDNMQPLPLENHICKGVSERLWQAIASYEISHTGTIERVDDNGNAGVGPPIAFFGCHEFFTETNACSAQ